MDHLYDDMGLGRLEQDDSFDPLSVQRSAPMQDEEAAIVEALCHAATPGPLVVDDQVQREGAVVASLPDGRPIVSLTAPVGHTANQDVACANAELFCKARHILLRLLRDRRQWQQERERLLEQISALEAALGPQPDGPSRPSRRRASPRPR